MPKIYEYKGFHFFFHSNDHLPPHCHISKAGVEIKAEFYIQGGLHKIITKKVSRKIFSPQDMRVVMGFLYQRFDEVVEKWYALRDEFVVPKAEKIYATKHKKDSSKEGN